MRRVSVVVVELRPCGRPFPGNPTFRIVLNLVFVVPAAQKAALAFFPRPVGCGPSFENSVPASQANPRGEVRHDELQICLASCRMNTGEAW